MTERSKNDIRETGGVFGGLRHVVGKYFQYGNSRRTRRMRREVTIDRSLLMTETAHDVPVNSVADAMGIAVVNRCVQLISGAVSSLPLRLLACGADGVFAAVPEGDANNLQYLLSVQPNDRDSAVEFWARAVQQMLLLGNAYIIPRYFESAPYALMELRLVGADASVVYDRYSETYTVTDLAQGLSGRYAEGDIVRLSCPSYDGTPVGVGLIAAANTALRTVATADREMLRRFANGCMPTGFITNPRTVEGYGEVQDEELDRLAGALRYNMRHGDYLNVLYGNAEFHGVQMTAQDAQFVQNRQWALRDICRFFGVHPSYVMDETSSNYKSAEMANVAFLSNTLNPLLRKIENELQRKLLSRGECARRRIAFDRSQLYACDLDSKARYMSALLGAGVATVNELRRADGRHPVDGGDTPMVSANLRPVNGNNTNNENNANNGKE